MYYPYFRGKQFELITIRQNAPLMHESGIVPIIEPVKKSFSSLKRTTDALIDANARFILIINPGCGEFKKDNKDLIDFADESIPKTTDFSIAYIAGQEHSEKKLNVAIELSDELAIVHKGYSNASEIASQLDEAKITEHFFVEESCSRLYRRHFREGHNKILIQDGFTQRNNREHPRIEHFSDLHITYEEEGVDGFGDFLIVGDTYSETGGPAYAVAIHITFIDPKQDDDMFMKHYVSDRVATPVDPGGKFLEALGKLVEDIECNQTSILKTKAISEFIKIHQQQHFPGLGYVKKLSMQHHVELMASYLTQLGTKT